VLNPQGAKLPKATVKELSRSMETIKNELKAPWPEFKARYENFLKPLFPDSIGDHGANFLAKFTPDAASFQLRISPKMQHLLTWNFHHIQNRFFVENISKLGDAEKARLSAITAAHSNDWIKAIPSLNVTTLHDDAYRRAARLRLGLKPHDFSHLVTECGVCHSNIEKDPWHYLTCKGYRKTMLGARHDTIVKAVQEVVQIAGGAVVCEPPRTSMEDLRRPDHLIALDNKLIYTDVSVTHPTSLSYVSQKLSLQSLQLAEKKAKEKIVKYRDIIPQAAEFNPFVVETYGGFGSHAQHLLNQISVYASEHQSVWTEKEVGNFLRFSVAIHIQRGNARAVHHGYTCLLRCIHAPIRRPRRFTSNSEILRTS